MQTAIVALGANLGDPWFTLPRALDEMQVLGKGLIASTFHVTEPVSSVPQAPFLNAVCAFETDLSLESLFCALEKIEVGLGKVKKPKDAPRLIDLDLLFYGEEEIKKGDLIVPHPRWKERLFVLVPLLEIRKEVVVCGKRWDIKQLIRIANAKCSG